MAAERAGIAALDVVPAADCEAALLECCGSREWARRLTACRPFRDLETLIGAADRVWLGLTHADWLEAFRSHPRIGESKAVAKTTVREQSWSSDEQSGLRGSPGDVRATIARLNAEYERRFGHIFLVDAEGKGPENILAALRERLLNEPEVELRAASAEQASITRRRLRKLVGRSSVPLTRT